MRIHPKAVVTLEKEVNIHSKAIVTHQTKMEHSLRTSCHTSEENEQLPESSRHNLEENGHAPETSVHILASSEENNCGLEISLSSTLSSKLDLHCDIFRKQCWVFIHTFFDFMVKHCDAIYACFTYSYNPGVIPITYLT